ncbi:hypothetical protein C1H46_027512 [Malus baccata]|uniref:CLAVATA3/ESR (CLE)-related protein 25 n=1 Tax=Malus baccata TaxID=106549 RepID=A0A540LK93_MALBA|nr:hypothetical protein C1H46_027512 [Malus baccata]
MFGALLLLGVFWFFLAGILVNRSAEKPAVTVSPTEIFKHWKLIGREKHAVVWDSTFIYVSKRRVPNGPDPIHNRRDRELLSLPTSGSLALISS